MYVFTDSSPAQEIRIAVTEAQVQPEEGVRLDLQIEIQGKGYGRTYPAGARVMANGKIYLTRSRDSSHEAEIKRAVQTYLAQAD